MKKLYTTLTLVLISSILFAQLPSYVPTNGLVGWWPFNGNANDESGNGNNGAVNGATLTADRFGNANAAYYFNGISDFIQMNAIGSTYFENDFSISIWLNVLNFNNDYLHLVSGENNFITLNANGPYYFADSTKISAYQGPVLPTSLRRIPYFASDSSLMQNTNYHVVFIKNQDTAYLYLNGILASITAVDNLLSIPSGNYLQIGTGYNNSPNYCFAGELDDIGIWNRALTQQEVTNLYNGSLPGTCVGSSLPVSLHNGLVGWWPFCGNAADESGNGNNGVVNGATLTVDRFGNSGSAYEFTGGESISVSSSPSLENISNTYSLSSWVNISSFNSSGPGHFPILDKSTTCPSTPGSSPFLFIGSDTTLGYHVQNIDCGVATMYGGSGQPSTLGQWEHVVAVYDSVDIKIFINGILMNTTPSSGVVTMNNADLTFGLATFAGLQYAYGTLDDIGIWNRALTQQEITNLYNTGICFQTITVTDTLIINANLTGFNPITYQNTIKVYPNPTNDHINIDFGSNYSTLAGYTMRIDNSIAQTVFSTPVNQQNYFVDMNTWTGNGVYFVYLVNGYGQAVDVRKIVVQ